ncbi:SURF1 family protein [Longivirga aurantiaca]|uniref:SURF1-like protein n=1 Tax=Longivirga aurantiaca TaxID=1837743 RepID=A0ABW1SZ69_9ACTN
MLATPRWIGLSVTALLLIVAFGGMSYWQWQRAQRDEIPVRETVAAAELLTADAPLAGSDYGAPVELTGTYDLAAQVLVDHGQGEFWVVTPLRPSTGPAVPIARGTVTSPTDPSAASVATGVVTVRGLAQPFEGDPGTAVPGEEGIVERLTASGLALPYPAVQGWVALTGQEPQAQPALVPVIPPFGVASGSGIRLQNAGYAVQWVLFAAFVVFVWWRFLREDARLAAEQAPPPVAEPSRPEIY